MVSDKTGASKNRQNNETCMIEHPFFLKRTSVRLNGNLFQHPNNTPKDFLFRFFISS